MINPVDPKILSLINRNDVLETTNQAGIHFRRKFFAENFLLQKIYARGTNADIAIQIIIFRLSRDLNISL